MIKELRKLEKTNRAKAVYIRSLQAKGAIKKIPSPLGYMCYDTEEYTKYKATIKHGRPCKFDNEEKGE